MITWFYCEKNPTTWLHSWWLYADHGYAYVPMIHYLSTVCRMPDARCARSATTACDPSQVNTILWGNDGKLGLVIVILLMMSYNFLVVSAIACIWKIVFLLFGICKVDTYLYKHLWFVYVIFTSVSNITILVCFLVCLSVFVCLSLSLSVCS